MFRISTSNLFHVITRRYMGLDKRIILSHRIKNMRKNIPIEYNVCIHGSLNSFIRHRILADMSNCDM